jgi:hypothetical protein
MTGPRIRRASSLRSWVRSWVSAAVAGGLLATSGCGGTSAKILERVDGAAPAGSHPRADIFMLQSISSCAVGRACTAGEASQCFYVADDAGTRTTFAQDGLRFVRPGDPATQTSDRVECCDLVLDDATATAARDLMNGLRASVFQSSGGNVDLDLRFHEIASLEAGFVHFSGNLFLPPSALEALGLASLDRDTDFVYAVSGFRDPETTLQPRVDFCAGTNWLAQGILGASPYTWLNTAERCRRPNVVMGSFLVQAFFAMRDIAGVTTPRDYPACGRGDPDPRQWFPGPDDCTTDPDAPACGLTSCPDQAAFFAHVLAAHWPRAAPYNGNYCADGQMDYDETGVDSGGVCDLIGR